MLSPERVESNAGGVPDDAARALLGPGTRPRRLLPGRGRRNSVQGTQSVAMAEEPAVHGPLFDFAPDRCGARAAIFAHTLRFAPRRHDSRFPRAHPTGSAPA